MSTPSLFISHAEHTNFLNHHHSPQRLFIEEKYSLPPPLPILNHRPNTDFFRDMTIDDKFLFSPNDENNIYPSKIPTFKSHRISVKKLV